MKSERTKHAIPNNEHAGKVFVDAVTVNTMVNSMVTWRVQDVFQQTYLANCLQHA